MDPLPCLAIAGAVAQFLDFGFNLASAMHALLKDGTSPLQAHAAQGVTELSGFILKFDAALHPGDLKVP